MDEAQSMEFREGQIVHIVSDSVDVGPGWAPSMYNFCGREAKIVCCYKEWFKLDIDDKKFWWSPEMFQEYYGSYSQEPDSSDAEIDLIISDILSQFNGNANGNGIQ